MKNGKMKTNIVGILIAIVLIFLDRITKRSAVIYLKDKPSLPIIKGVLELEYLENRGAAFGIFQNRTILFVIGTALILLAIVFFYQRIPETRTFITLRICAIGIVAGAIGNLIDRVKNHFVIDFIYFKLIDFPIFNVADIYVVLSCAGLAILFLFCYRDRELDMLFGKEK